MDMTTKDYVNWKMSHDVKYGETEGYPLVLEQCRKNKELKDFKIYGRSVQKSENLFDKSKVTSGKYVDDTGVEVTGGTTTMFSDYIEVVSGATYTIDINSPNSTSNNVRVNYYNSEQVWMSQTLYAISSTGTISKQITISDEVAYIRVSSRDANTIKVYKTNPTPETPIDVQNVGEFVTEGEYAGKYKVPVKARGKNFINEYRAFNTSSGLRVSAIGNLVTINGSDNANAALVYDSSKAILLKAGKTYTVSRRYVSGECLYSYSNGGFYVGLRKADNSWLANLDSITTTNYKTANRKTFTVTKDTLCSFGCVGNGEYNQLKMTVQLEEASNLTAHEPYIESQTFNIYLDAPLRKIGDYADYIDSERDVVVRNVGIHHFSGAEKWNIYDGNTSDGGKVFYLDNSVKQQPYYKDILSNYLKNSNDTGLISSWVSGEGRFQHNNDVFASSKRIYISTNLQTVTEFKNWLENNNVYVIFSLKTPTEEPINLPKLPKTQAKTMIYEVGTTIEPSNMYGKYVKKY